MSTKGRAQKAARQVRKRIGPRKVSERGTVTLYLDGRLYKAFRKECEGLGMAPSLVIEELMREFLA